MKPLPRPEIDPHIEEKVKEMEECAKKMDTEIHQLAKDSASYINQSEYPVCLLNL